MNSLSSPLLALVPAYGPWLIFVLAALETCFLTGLAVPSGMATSLATILALDGAMDLGSVVLAAAVGAAVGDSVGFWVGRLLGRRLVASNGRFASFFGRRYARVARKLGRHPVYSVTLARLLSFVRTMMPMAAGMSPLSYRRFLPYDLAGVIGWTALYVAVGTLAGESWEHVVRVLDVGGALALVFVLTAVWLVIRGAARRRDRRRAGAATDPSC